MSEPPEESEQDPTPDPLALARRVADAYRDGPAARPTTRRRPPPSPRRGSREDPVPLTHVLGDLVRSEGWEVRLSEQRVFSDWASVVGPEVAEHTTVTRSEERRVGK